MKHRLAVGNDGLDLDDHDPAGLSMPGKDVDRTTFPENRERHLDRHLPAVLLEQFHGSLDETCVRRVEKSIELFATPAQSDVQSSVQGRRDPDERHEGNLTRTAALDGRDQAP
ncbi:MAG TPA: hypothetical protein VHM48_01535 [Candidatus Limnocylindrales bacterium]|nr:hypothetical protein [Candidatus Limnocylindrales bacterium]